MLEQKVGRLSGGTARVAEMEKGDGGCSTALARRGNLPSKSSAPRRPIGCMHDECAVRTRACWSEFISLLRGGVARVQYAAFFSCPEALELSANNMT